METDVMISKRKIEVVIPTYNGGKKFCQVAEMLKHQVGITPNDVLIIDSSSSDQTVQVAKDAGFRVQIINKKNFGHGKTRRMAAEQSTAEYIVFMTQDAIPASDDSIIQLCKPLMENQNIGVTYGRQLPTPEAGAIGNHARLFNYPAHSQMKTKADIPVLGIKTIFCSDSFAAYNRESLINIGNFMDVNFGEDTLVAAKYIDAGYVVYYNSTVCVYHAHRLSLLNEMKRYIVIGEFHKKYKMVFDSYRKVSMEGFSFIKSELIYLLKEKRIVLIPYALIRNILKLVGYKYGMMISSN